MLATKDQERAALKKIKDIIAGLGENSYIATAFDGCIEDAEDNIENDFAFSMKDRYETAKNDAAEWNKMVVDLRAEVDSLQRKVLPDDLVKLIDVELSRSANRAEDDVAMTCGKLNDAIQRDDVKEAEVALKVHMAAMRVSKRTHDTQDQYVKWIASRNQSSNI